MSDLFRGDVPSPGRIREKCSSMRHPQNVVKRRRAANGSWQCVMYCERCQRVVTAEVDAKKRTFISKQEAMRRLTPDATFEDIPVLETDALMRQCYACDAFAFCEDDHVAERTIHGDLAELLPIVPLCPKCHAQKTRNLQDFINRLRGAA